MSTSNLEIESKFYVLNLGNIQNTLQNAGAKCIVPRKFEYNLRFDNHQNSLSKQRKVLRLRKYDDFRLTFKGPGTQADGALSRKEIELVVNDFDNAQKFLESLGYHVAAVYEKYRAMYEFNASMVTLDELPYGNFVEIEAENPKKIKLIAQQLGLNPDAAVPASYQGLFEKLKFSKNLNIKNLSFWEFEKLEISAEDLGVFPADVEN